MHISMEDAPRIDNGAALIGPVEAAPSASSASSASSAPSASSAARIHAIRSMTDGQLIDHADLAVRREHRSVIALIDAIAEIDRRSVYLDLGYSSLFDYCTRRWAYSPATAARYIAASRAAARFPAARALLEDRRLTICGLARLARSLTQENCATLIALADGKTFVEIETMVAARESAPRLPDRIRAVGTAVPRTRPASPVGLGLFESTGSHGAEDSRAARGSERPQPAQARISHGCGESVPGQETRSTSTAAHIQRGCSEHVPDLEIAARADVDIQRGCGDPAPVSTSGVPGCTANELRYEIRFTAGRRFVEKLARARSLSSSGSELEAVFERALDDLLDRRDPQRRIARPELRRKRGRLQFPADGASARPARVHAPERIASDTRPACSGGPEGRTLDTCRLNSPRRASPSRHIPKAIRDAVFIRDGVSACIEALTALAVRPVSSCSTITSYPSLWAGHTRWRTCGCDAGSTIVTGHETPGSAKSPGTRRPARRNRAELPRSRPSRTRVVERRDVKGRDRSRLDHRSK
jgi:hypothetical protein